MAWVNVLAGSFIAGTGHHYSDGRFRLLTMDSPNAGEDISVAELIEISPADPRSERLIGAVSERHGPLQWRVSQWLVSPVRSITRLLPRDPMTQISFQAKFKDGRRMIAKTDIKTFREIDHAVVNGVDSNAQAQHVSNVSSISATTNHTKSARRKASSAAAAFSTRKDIEQTVINSENSRQHTGSAKVTPLRKV